MQAREEMCKERQRYLEALAVYIEMTAMVEEYQQATPVSNLSGIRDVQGLYPQLGLKNLPQVHEVLEHRMVVAEAAQRLRLPLISKDGEIHEEEIEKLSIVSRSSLDSTSTSITMSSSTNSTNYTNVPVLMNTPFSVDVSEPEVGGVPNRFLGITPSYLWQTQLQRTPLSMACAHHNFGELCLCLAMSYLDRFLSVYNLPGGKTWAIHLAAVTCLSLAAKIDEVNVPNTVNLQAGEPKFLFEGKTIKRMEMSPPDVECAPVDYAQWDVPTILIEYVEGSLPRIEVLLGKSANFDELMAAEEEGKEIEETDDQN
ncbi:hypothetical protein CASFOL_001924 [Castilleja foliolosa]|uniref:Cyclin-like domain-containing protein n=1 Tax=Castilleja foliolosa TaxID=1961234 RepID=A0ABD3ECT6_9LAMI